MEVLHPHCAGLDIHKDSVVACVRHMVKGKVATEVRVFQTTTRELMDRTRPRNAHFLLLSICDELCL